MTFKDVMLEVVVPLLGNVLSCLTFLSPVAAVRNFKHTHNVENINGLPYLMMFLQSGMWIIYAYLIDKPLIVPVNLIGVSLGMYFSLSYVGELPQHEAMSRMSADVAARWLKTRRNFERGMAASAFFPATLISLLYFLDNDADRRNFIYGIILNVITVSFYASPLASLAEVIKKRNAISISAPLALCCTLTGGVWTLYGFAINDLFIYVPNGLATLLGIAQLTMRAIYPAHNNEPNEDAPFLAVNTDPMETA